MTRRIAAAALVVCVSVLLLYLSRFWPVQLWTRQDLLAQAGLLPGGDMLRIWLRGTVFAPFDLLLWSGTVFVVLSWTEKLTQKLNS